MICDDHRKPLAHYGAIKGALARGCSAELHHQQGRDRFKSDSSSGERMSKSVFARWKWLRR